MTGKTSSRLEWRPACGNTLALGEELDTCDRCGGEFGPCCIEPGGICVLCEEEQRHRGTEEEW